MSEARAVSAHQQQDDEAWMSFIDRLKGRGTREPRAGMHDAEDSSIVGPYTGSEDDGRDTVQDHLLGTTISVPDAIISEASPSVLSSMAGRRGPAQGSCSPSLTTASRHIRGRRCQPPGTRD